MSGRPLIVFAAGGTGGHLFPPIAVAEALRDTHPDVDIEFFCTDRPIDAKILDPTGWLRQPQSVRPLAKQPWRWPAFLRGWRESHRLCQRRFAERRPAVVVGTGGFASLPPIRTARRFSIPTALLNPDAIPGRANHHLAGGADAVFVQWASSVQHFPRADRVHVTGCPVRHAFVDAVSDGAAVRMGLDPTRKTLLVTGASQGAGTINEAMVGLLDGDMDWNGWQVLHLAGTRDAERLRDLYKRRGVAGRVLAFCDEMPDALAAADLVLARAGASTLAELTAVGRAAILLPYPFHRDNHQTANATELALRGAAEIVPDRIVASENVARLRPVLTKWMRDEAGRAAMANASRSMSRPDAASDVAQRLIEWIAAPECTGVAEPVACAAAGR